MVMERVNMGGWVPKHVNGHHGYEGAGRTCGRISARRSGRVVSSVRVVGETVAWLVRGRALVSGRLVDGRDRVC